jgi:hypothetical protein
MADLTANRPESRQGDTNSVLLPILAASIIDNVHFYAGGMAGLDANGRAVKASSTAAVQVPGVFRKEYDNTVSGHVIDAFSVEIVLGCVPMKIGAGADALTNANKFQDVYVIDDQTVGATNGGATPRLRAGYLVEVVGTFAFVMMGVANPNATSAVPAPIVGSAPTRARGVVIANQAALATFTVANNGITYVQNDIVLLTAQTTAAENGPYIVGVVAAGVAPLTRPDGWQTGDAIPAGFVIEVGAGNTLLPSSSWKAMVVAGKIVGTDDPKFYPRHVKATVTLAGNPAIYALGATEGLFLFSTTQSDVQVTLDTPAGTLGTWGVRAPVAGMTAGVSGIAAVTVRSTLDNGADATADTSTYRVNVTNW